MSTIDTTDKVKVHVSFPDDGGGESMWATPLEHDGLYRIDNIPFLVTGIALHDVVRCFTTLDGTLEVLEVFERSGNDTIFASWGPLDGGAPAIEPDAQREAMRQLAASGYAVEGVVPGVIVVSCGEDEIDAATAQLKALGCTQVTGP